MGLNGGLRHQTRLKLALPANRGIGTMTKHHNKLNGPKDQRLVLTQARVRELFDYDQKIGNLIRRTSQSSKNSVGDIVGYRGNNGYLYVRVDGRLYLVHRVIWMYVHGYFPEHYIDHINRDKCDNRLENLREATNKCNMRNSKLRSDNKTGITGIFLLKDRGKWLANIRVDNKTKFLGEFIDFTEAVAHRLAAEECLFWSRSNSNSTAYQYMQNYLKEIRCQTGNKEQ